MAADRIEGISARCRCCDASADTSIILAIYAVANVVPTIMQVLLRCNAMRCGCDGVMCNEMLCNAREDAMMRSAMQWYVVTYHEVQMPYNDMQ